MRTAAELLQLAERCEREEPSRELDGEIALAIGWEKTETPPAGENWVRPDKRFAYPSPPCFTISLDAAVTLLVEGDEWQITNLYGIARAEANMNASKGPTYGEHKGGHMALALCSAALRARAAMAGKP